MQANYLNLKSFILLLHVNIVCLVIEAQIVPNNTELIKPVVFPNNARAFNLTGVQVTIPTGAIIHQRETEGINLFEGRLMLSFCIYVL